MVGDRGNNRIQIFDQEGNFSKSGSSSAGPSGIFIDRNDVIYVADSQSDANRNRGFKRGMRIGSAKDGSVQALIPESDRNRTKSPCRKVWRRMLWATCTGRKLVPTI